MGLKVVVGDGQTVAEAWEQLERLRELVYRRPWTKRRYGYHEKPCTVRRREKRLRRMRARGYGWYHRFPVGVDVQLRRTGPNNAIGR